MIKTAKGKWSQSKPNHSKEHWDITKHKIKDQSLALWPGQNTKLPWAPFSFFVKRNTTCPSLSHGALNISRHTLCGHRLQKGSTLLLYTLTEPTSWMIKPTFLININSVQRILKVLGDVLYFSCLDVWVCMHTHLCVWIQACECHSTSVEGRGQRQMSALTVHLVWVGDSPCALLCTSSSVTYRLPERDSTTPICTWARDLNSGHHAYTSKHFLSLP